MFSRYNLRSIVGFHTRNVPHKAHEWIHTFGLKKCEGLFIQPIIGQFKKNEYKEKIIIKSNLKLIKEIYKKKNIFFLGYLIHILGMLALEKHFFMQS